MITASPPRRVPWRAESYVPSLKGEGWGKRSLQSAPASGPGCRATTPRITF